MTNSFQLEVMFIEIILSIAGGVLDRVDSYLLTGALAYSFIKFLELYGVWCSSSDNNVLHGSGSLRYNRINTHEWMLNAE